MENKLECIDIHKTFGQTKANSGISISASGGKIYGLLGENGAGKTTLLSILFGLYRPDRGEILVNGERVKLNSPKDAVNRGIYLVQQNFSLIDNFSVSENIELMKGLSVRPTNLQETRKQIESLTDKMGLDVNPDALIETLPMGLRQRVEILKGLLYGARVLLMDEPTSVLGPNEVEALSRALKSLILEGKIVIITSHKIDQVINLCDHFVVLRRGRVVFDGSASEIGGIQELTRRMFGEDLVTRLPTREQTRIEKVLLAKNLVVLGDKKETLLNNVSIEVRRGEVFGIAGIAGNGQKQLAEVISGLRKPDGGTVELGGRDIFGLGLKQMRKFGLGYIPEEGDLVGLVPDFTVAENLSLTTYDEESSSVLLEKSQIRARADKLIEEYGITPPNVEALSRNLSGGNMQKLIAARELSRKLKLLVAFNPTKGLDLKTASLVSERILSKKNEGTAVVLFSEDLEEVLQLSDTIAAIYEGEIVYVKEAGKISLHELGEMISQKKH